MTTVDAIKPHILVITEEHHVRTIITDALAKEGYEMAYCGNGAQALEYLKQSPADVLIAEYALPDMNAIDLVKNIGALSVDVTPVIISEVGSLEIALEGMKLGVHDYMIKPLNGSELKRNVSNILSERERAKQGATKAKEVVSRIVVRPMPDIIPIVVRESEDDDDANVVVRLLRKMKRAFRKAIRFLWDSE